MSIEKKAVREVLERCNTNNPIEICDLLEINLRFADIGEYRGMYRKSADVSFITINENLPEYLIKAVCSHELGHFTMHQHINRIFMDTAFFYTSKCERQADRFAAYLMLSDYDIREFEGFSATQVSMMTGIPFEYLHLIIRQESN